MSKIYVASSWRNAHQPMVVELLRNHSLERLKQSILTGQIVHIDTDGLARVSDSMQELADQFEVLSDRVREARQIMDEFYERLYTPGQRLVMPLHWWMREHAPWVYARPATRRLRIWLWRALQEG